MASWSVLGLKPGHDGSAALLVDGTLAYSLEAEEDSFERHSPLTAQLFLQAMSKTPSLPDAVAIGGWYKVLPGLDVGIAAGYRGLEPGKLEHSRLFGAPVTLYSSSHERSHIFGGVGMSPFDPHGEIAVLVWEGVIGALYRWSENGRRILPREVMAQPGTRYSTLLALSDPDLPDRGGFPPASYAGKLMALVSFADADLPSEDSIRVVESLLRTPSLNPFDKGRYHRSPLYNGGASQPEFCRTARFLSDRIFTIYLEAARDYFEPGLPLVAVGGCGLNCEWNTRWRDCGHFSDVFVPPSADDSGSAIGTALDAAVQMGATCELAIPGRRVRARHGSNFAWLDQSTAPIRQSSASPRQGRRRRMGPGAM